MLSLPEVNFAFFVFAVGVSQPVFYYVPFVIPSQQNGYHKKQRMKNVFSICEIGYLPVSDRKKIDW